MICWSEPEPEWSGRHYVSNAYTNCECVVLVVGISTLLCLATVFAWLLWILIAGNPELDQMPDRGTSRHAVFSGEFGDVVADWMIRFG